MGAEKTPEYGIASKAAQVSKVLTGGFLNDYNHIFVRVNICPPFTTT
jgi:hypothetical protein